MNLNLIFPFLTHLYVQCFTYMPTNLTLDGRLIKEAKRAGKHKIKKEAFNAALDECVRKRKQMRILEAFGTFEVAPPTPPAPNADRVSGERPSKVRGGTRRKS